MKILKYSLLLIVAIVLLCCEEKENFQFCDAIQKAYQARCTRSMRGINTDSLAIINAVCIEKGDMSSYEGNQAVFSITCIRFADAGPCRLQRLGQYLRRYNVG